MDLSESIVGAYYRSVEHCHSVTYNTFLPTGQGEIDVIGLRLGQATMDVFAAEIAVHLDGLHYGDNIKVVTKKMQTARAFVERVYSTSTVTLEFWSPVVSKGPLAKLQDLQQELDFQLVANEDFTARMQALVDVAKTHTKTTGEPAYRMLQLLTHLRGSLKL